MGDFITALTSATGGLSAASFSSQLTALVPFLVIMIPLSFGLRALKKAVKGSAKGKVNL